MSTGIMQPGRSRRWIAEMHSSPRCRKTFSRGCCDVDGSAPRRRAIDKHMSPYGRNSSLQTENPHPIEDSRAREKVRT